MDDNKFHAMITVKFQGGEINGYQISDQKDLQCFIDMVEKLTKRIDPNTKLLD